MQFTSHRSRNQQQHSAAAAARSAEDMYIEALELMLEDRTPAAITQFDLLLEQHPKSEFADRAERWITELNLRRDTSGLVGFYLGNQLHDLHLGLPTAEKPRY